MVKREKMASTAPAAVRLCPILDLFDDIGIDPARSPNTALTPIHSILSFSGVPVPCALMYPTSCGSSPASSRAFRMQAIIGLPSGEDLVRWKPSATSPHPLTSP